MKHLLLATQVPVGQMHSAESKMEQVLVHALLIMLGILMKVVDLNVFSIQIVLQIVPVSEINVKILVLEHVAKMQTAK
jgi:hypothetical protein